MILSEKETIRTDVENLFLREMVEEDNSFLYLNESMVDSALDTMTEISNDSIFDSVSESADLDIDDEYDDFLVT